MHSSKCVKRTKTYRYLRNHNARKRAAHIRQKANLSNWISSTIEGKCVKSVSLCAIRQAKPQNQTNDQTVNKKEPKKAKVKEPKIEAVEAKPSHSQAYEAPKVAANTPQSKNKKQQQDQKKAEKVKIAEEHKKKDEQAEVVEEQIPVQKVQKQETDKSSKGNQKVEIPSVKQTSGKKKAEKKKEANKKQRTESTSSTVIKAEVEHFPQEIQNTGTNRNSNLSNELMVDVDSHGLSAADKSSLTKCSEDSGVDTCPDELHQRSGSNSISNGSESNNNNDESNTNTKSSVVEEGGILTKFAQNVVDFVTHVQEKLEVKEQHIMTSTTTEQFAIKNDYSDLQKVKPLSVKPRQKKDRVYKLLPRDIEYCTHMMENYGEDYQGMAKDPKNVYMDDPKGIARKIRIFRESPHYEEYVNAQQSK